MVKVRGQCRPNDRGVAASVSESESRRGPTPPTDDPAAAYIAANDRASRMAFTAGISAACAATGIEV